MIYTSQSRSKTKRPKNFHPQPISLNHPKIGKGITQEAETRDEVDTIAIGMSQNVNFATKLVIKALTIENNLIDTFHPPPRPQQQNQQGPWQSSHNNNNYIHPQAHTTNTQYKDSLNTNWYPDSSTSHHVTADISNIQQSTPYTFLDELYIINGRGFQILSTSSTTIHKNSHSLKLNNILHVPHIKKNLLFVKKFTEDNNIFLGISP